MFSNLFDDCSQSLVEYQYVARRCVYEIQVTFHSTAHVELSNGTLSMNSIATVYFIIWIQHIFQTFLPTKK